MQCDTDLWLSDGDLIVQADNLSFRLYSKVLAANSTVFADMLAFPPPIGDTPSNDTMDGLPIVRLFDSAADAKLLLKAIFDPTFFRPPPSPTDILVVLDILRMSNKYDATELFRRALLHLDTIYPTSLQQFPDIPRQLHPGGPLVGHCAVISAAVAFGVPWLLPSLYYEISCYPIRDILAVGATWDELPLSTRRQILTTHPGRFERLRLVNWFKFDEVHGCDWREGCPYNSMSSASQLFAFIAHDRTMDPLRYWNEEAKTKFRDTRCSICREGFERLIEEGREEIWKGLPAAAGFTGWPELEMKRQAVIGT
ncbi:hypothetical protein B0H19DRAFT_1121730 [Mycena capillaripes]|nr:hypothetical protein B0H19DRAFT_1121730 [Mycena capillaripes]